MCRFRRAAIKVQLICAIGQERNVVLRRRGVKAVLTAAAHRPLTNRRLQAIAERGAVPLTGDFVRSAHCFDLAMILQDKEHRMQCRIATPRPADPRLCLDLRAPPPPMHHVPRNGRGTDQFKPRRIAQV